jgi:hypothetical protein
MKAISIPLSVRECLLGFLFTGALEVLPCGDGTRSHAANLAAFDWQSDGAIDLSDAVAGLKFLFGGGPAHARSVPGQERTGCVAIEGCPGRCP